MELGLVSRAEALYNQIRDHIDTAETKEDNINMLNQMAVNADKFDETICEITGKTIEQLKSEYTAPTKNAVDLRNTLMRDYLKDQLFKHRVICPMCKGRNGTLRNDDGRSILVDFGTSGLGKAKMPRTLAAKLDDGPIEEYMEEVADINGLDNGNGVSIANVKNALIQQLEDVATLKCDKLTWRGAEVREHFRLLWRNESAILRKLFPLFDRNDKKECPMDVLFYELLLVPPTKYRPMRFFQGERYEDSQTIALRKILECNEAVVCTRLAMDPKRNDEFVEKFRVEYKDKLRGHDLNEKLHFAYIDLQAKVNALYDNEPSKIDPGAPSGIRQLLEKKQGLFRMNMMGKRVNYACRSVITPDPYLDVDEIGIPEIFAKKLTFPTSVSGLNINKMREYIERGPQVYPGANYVSSQGIDDKRILSENEKERRQYSRLLDPGTKTDGSVTVFRHLLPNEMVLMNRQPSLHKPSIMGHRVRILRGQRALRMNYAPCKAYNADFDGDEMNGHFIQNMVGQVEARELVNVGSSYLVPKDGTPILGLIQDHVVSGVLLTLRDTFLTKADFTHLVLTAFSKCTQRINIPHPAIFYPEKLWTGKQVITCIVRNCVPDGAQLINLHGKAKTPLSCWKVDDLPPPKMEMSESEVIFSRGALVNGVLDKAHYGATQYGLIHCCYELYGHRVATKIMSCFSRCFTTYLQFHGFSLGVADILVKRQANKERRKIIKQLRKEGENVVKKAFNLPEDATPLMIKHSCAKAYNNNNKMKNDVKMLDFTMKQVVGKHNTNITNACVPNGLIRSFPQNSLQLMIQSGAKGSSVNAIQISCALGQIELEGQRPGLSATGRTLPSFKPFDPSPRAGGFVDQRFLTGIDPQELFFHTMAGREGLIDTAVKTSRSGYLQRCIIKHLEGITANYDGTVRDHDGSVIQFKYGEDGLDVGRATFLNPKQFNFLEKNLQALRESSVPSEAKEEQFNMELVEKAFRKIKKRMKKQPAEKRVFKSGFSEFSSNYIGVSKKEIVEKWFELDDEEKQQWNAESGSSVPDPVDVQYNVYRTLGALPEKMLFELDKYMKKMSIPNEEFKKSIFWKGLRAVVEPGENVGLLAAQSIGEPSTQMTLNTFHFAGRGEMNVTLGIPRLREILMTSGARIATPSAEIRIFDGATEEDVERLKAKFNRVYLKQCIKNIRIEERIDVTPLGSDRIFIIGVEISKTKDREVAARHISRAKVIKALEASFIRQICAQINKMTRDMQNFDAIVHRKLKMANEGVDEGDIQQKKKKDDESSDEEIEAGPEIDAAEQRLRNRHLDDAAEYEGEDVEEAEVAMKEPTSIESAFIQLAEQEETDKEDDDDEESGNGDDVTYNESAEARRNRVINSAAQCEDYSFDTKHNRWCMFTIKLLLDRNKVNVNVIVENVVENFVIHQTDKVEKCVIRTEQKDGTEIRILQTQGINLEAFYECADVLDVNSIYSNDLNLMLDKYGVEACNRSIVKEMNNVFSVYGIDVNPRHLTLVADYMTFTGRIAPFSRTAMASSPSPLQKMTFETTMTFMRDTLIGGFDDHLHSPSSRIVTGQLIKGGTGSFELFFNPYVVFKEKTEVPEVEIMDTRKVVFSDSDDD